MTTNWVFSKIYNAFIILLLKSFITMNDLAKSEVKSKKVKVIKTNRFIIYLLNNYRQYPCYGVFSITEINFEGFVFLIKS